MMPTAMRSRARAKRWCSFVLFLALLVLSACGGGSGIPVSGTQVTELLFVDTMMAQIMKDSAIDGGSVAIAKDGRLVYARGFGYADREQKTVVQPGDVFRIASVSKIVTGMAATKLVQDGLLNLEEKVFGPTGILNDAIYAQIKDARVLDIKVKHLLTHTSGWYGEMEDDPQYKFVEIAQALGVAPPASSANVVEYVLKTGELQFDPGAQYLYSNVGYNILGRIIEKKSGMPYEEYVRSILTADPIGVTDMFIAGNLEADRRPNEVRYYDASWCVDAAYDGSGRQVPCSYGNMNIPTMDSHGGWIASPTDLLRLLTAIDGFASRPDIFTDATIRAMKLKPEGVTGAHAYSGWGIDAEDNWSHTGALTTGTAAYLYRGADELEIAIIFNHLPGGKDDLWDVLKAFFGKLDDVKARLNDVTAWPAHDLF